MAVKTEGLDMEKARFELLQGYLIAQFGGVDVEFTITFRSCFLLAPFSQVPGQVGYGHSMQIHNHLTDVP